jgi:hypothetical protein
MPHPSLPPRFILILAAAALLASALACNFGRSAPAPETPATPQSAPVEPTSLPAEPQPQTATPTEAPLPTEALPPTEAPLPTAPAGTPFQYEGISLRYDPALAGAINVETVPAMDTTDGPYWDVYPEHIKLSMVDYPLAGTFHKPYILIYPVDAYIARSEFAATTITELADLLAAQPAAPEQIPFLPFFNAAQIMRVDVQYLDFQNGSGVRFLTQYAQSFAVINSQELFYTFQGLTDDGDYYVTAVLPVGNPMLPADGTEIPGGDFQKFADGYQEYMKGIVEMLSALPDETYTPSLAALDALIASLAVNP